MNEPIRRLLFTEEPHPNESFIGYVLRIAGLNEIPDLRWIFRLAASRLYTDSGYEYNFDFKINTFNLSKILGIGETKLKGLLYVRSDYGRKHNRKFLSFYGHPIHQDLINRRLPKICPACLIKNNYCLKIWEAAFITTCPIHKCLLLAYCPGCDNMLEWARPKIHLCRCRFDFRKSKLVSVKDKELRMVNYFYNAFGLSSTNPEVTLDYPLNTLNPERLLKLLYFVVAYYEKSSDYSSYRTGIYRGNKQIHKQLNSAVEVFDNWALNYHKFIESWSRRYKDLYIDHKLIAEFNLKMDSFDYKIRMTPFDYKYGSFEKALRGFTKKYYPFLYSEFEEFKKKLPAEYFIESCS